VRSEKMGRKKKYANAAEKQRAWRIRTGKQKAKVPIPIRRGEKLGTSEAQLRAKKEGETWKEYDEYLHQRVSRARTAKAYEGVPAEGKEGDSLRARRAGGAYVEPEMSEDYYELRAQYEKGLYELEQKKGRKIGEKK